LSERMRDLRWPLVTALVVVAAMFAAFTVTRSDAATGASQAPNQTIQSESTPTPQPGDRDADGRDCPEHDGQGGGRGFGGGGEQGTAPQTAPAAPSTSGTEL
jgi:hypothetical protein